MKLANLIDGRFHAALSKLSAEPLPLKVTFKLKGISKAVQEEFAKYEEVRQEALKKHGMRNEDGSLKHDESKNVQFTDEGMKAFSAELQELMSLDVAIPTVKASELGSNLKLTIAEVNFLEGVVLED